MKIMVVYASRRGSTAKVAQAIAEVFGTTAKRPDEILPEDMTDVDLLFAGSGVYFGRMGQDLEGLLTRLPLDYARGAAVFCTYQHYNTLTLRHITDTLTMRGIPIIGKFSCCGRYYFLKRNHPNEMDLYNAKEFARKIADQFLTSAPLPRMNWQERA